LVTNYYGLQLTTRTETANFPYGFCDWVVDNGNGKRIVEYVYSRLLTPNCGNRTLTDDDFSLMINCMIVDDFFTTNLTIISPLQVGMWNTFLQCIEDITMPPIRIQTFTIIVTG